MKVISCPNCNKQVSNLSTKCPHCGSLITGTPGSKYETAPPRGSGSKLGWIVIVLAILAGAYYYYFMR